MTPENEERLIATLVRIAEHLDEIEEHLSDLAHSAELIDRAITRQSPPSQT